MAAASEQNITVHTQRERAAPPREHGRWSVNKIEALFNLPFPELLHRAQIVHRENFDPTQAAGTTRFCMSAAPASTLSARKPMSLPRLREMRAQGEKITLLTAYDATVGVSLETMRPSSFHFKFQCNTILTS